MKNIRASKDKDLDKLALHLKTMKFFNSGILAGIILLIIVMVAGLDISIKQRLISIVYILISIGFVNLLFLLYYTAKATKKGKK